MKCTNCDKEIPQTSQVCPFCYSPVEHVNQTPLVPNVTEDTSSLTTINPIIYQENNETNFGDVNDNTTYDDEHNTLQAYMQEPKKRKKLLIPIIGVLLIFVGIFLVLSIIKGPAVEHYKYYTGVVDGIYNYINNTFTGRDVKNSGSYKIYYTIEGETKEFKGNYQLDLHKRLLDITGSLKNPEEERGGVVINDRTLNIELIGKNSDLYFISKEIYENPILLPYEDETGLFVTKQYNLDVLVDSVHEAINKAFKSMTYYEEKNVTENIRDKDMSVNKKILKLDNPAKKQFVSVFYDTLINDYNFVSEYAKIKSRKAEEMEKILKNYKTSSELKYSANNDLATYINIYYKGKDVYRFEIDNKQIDGSYLKVDFDNNKLTIEGFEKENKYKLVISKIDTYMNEILTRTYMFDFSYNDKPITINLELTKDNNPTIKLNEVRDPVSIRDFNDEQMKKLKETVKPYTKYGDSLDKIKEIFSSVCSKELSCICNDNEDVCQCNHNSNIITCPKSLVEVKEPVNNIVTE